jgi:hypothetical protein
MNCEIRELVSVTKALLHKKIGREGEGRSVNEFTSSTPRFEGDKFY